MKSRIRYAVSLVLAVALFWGIFHWLGLDGDHPVGETHTGGGAGKG